MKKLTPTQQLSNINILLRLVLWDSYMIYEIKEQLDTAIKKIDEAISIVEETDAEEALWQQQSGNDLIDLLTGNPTPDNCVVRALTA